MKASYNWLKDLLKLKQTPQQLAELLTLYFTETTVKSLGKRPILDVELLSNQVGWASGHLSLAREISANLNKRFDFPKILIKEDQKISVKNLLSLEIKTDNCKYYSARILQGVKVKESPQWLQERLKDCGVRPINNLVDAANYVMLETGQPLHVFDFETLDSLKSKKTIIIRQAKEKEILNALDKENYTLNKEMMVIADSVNAIAVAGIKGGQATAVSSKTHSIILESANFKESNIRFTSKSLGLATDASWRFEHNIPFELTVYALDRLAELIQQIAGGKILKGKVEKVKNINDWKKEAKKILIKWENWEKFLGWSIAKKEIKQKLNLLGFLFEEHKEGLLVRQPKFRNDIQIKEDVMGEVARLEGIDLIVPILPKAELKSPIKNEFWLFREKIKDWLKGCKLKEVYSYSFVSLEDKNVLPELWKKKVIEIENPTSVLTKYLRPTLLTNLLKSVQGNFRFKDQIRFFEIGKIYTQKTESFVLGGVLAQKTLDNNNLFFQVKGIIESLLSNIGVNQHKYVFKSLEKTAYANLLKQGAAIFHNKQLIGVLGKPQDFLFKQYEGQGEIIFWEIELLPLFSLKDEEKEFQPLPKYPAITRDVSFIIARNILIDEILDNLRKASPRFLEKVDLFDIFLGKNLPHNSKSLSFHLVFRSLNHTLTNLEVDKEMKKIYQALERLGANMR